MNVERRNKRGNATLNVQLHCRESDLFLSISLSLFLPLSLSLSLSLSHSASLSRIRATERAACKARLALPALPATLRDC